MQHIPLLLLILSIYFLFFCFFSHLSSSPFPLLFFFFRLIKLMINITKPIITTLSSTYRYSLFSFNSQYSSTLALFIPARTYLQHLIKYSSCSIPFSPFPCSLITNRLTPSHHYCLHYQRRICQL